MGLCSSSSDDLVSAREIGQHSSCVVWSAKPDTNQPNQSSQSSQSTVQVQTNPTQTNETVSETAFEAKQVVTEFSSRGMVLAESDMIFFNVISPPNSLASSPKSPNSQNSMHSPNSTHLANSTNSKSHHNHNINNQISDKKTKSTHSTASFDHLSIPLAISKYVFQQQELLVKQFHQAQLNQYKSWQLQKEKCVCAKVLEVIDGDTIKVCVLLDTHLEEVTCRFARLDAPELKDPDSLVQKHAYQCKQLVHDILHERIVKLIVRGKEKFGRLLCDVEVAATTTKTSQISQTSQKQDQKNSKNPKDPKQDQPNKSTNMSPNISTNVSNMYHLPLKTEDLLVSNHTWYECPPGCEWVCINDYLLKHTSCKPYKGGKKPTFAVSDLKPYA